MRKISNGGSGSDKQDNANRSDAEQTKYNHDRREFNANFHFFLFVLQNLNFMRYIPILVICKILHGDSLRFYCYFNLIFISGLCKRFMVQLVHICLHAQ